MAEMRNVCRRKNLSTLKNQKEAKNQKFWGCQWGPKSQKVLKIGKNFLLSKASTANQFFRRRHFIVVKHNYKLAKYCQ